MAPIVTVLVFLISLLALSTIIYWLLVTTEGAYLGQGIVTLLYDITADRYDNIKQFNDKVESVFLGQPLVASLPLDRVSHILDIATGTARLPLALLREPGFHGRIIGLDHSLKMLHKAAEKTRDYEDNLVYVWKDAARLPFPHDVFDMVCCMEMLEFTPNPEAQLVEAVRVLKPGGTFVTTRRRGLNQFLMPGKTHSPTAFETLLDYAGCTNIQIQRWQVEYDLVTAVKSGDGLTAGAYWQEVLLCPACNINDWIIKESALTCGGCGNQFSFTQNIIHLSD